jgi:hypothetical protein
MDQQSAPVERGARRSFGSNDTARPATVLNCESYSLPPSDSGASRRNGSPLMGESIAHVGDLERREEKPTVDVLDRRRIVLLR